MNTEYDYFMCYHSSGTAFVIYRIPKDWYTRKMGHNRVEFINKGLWKTSSMSIINLMEMNAVKQISKEDAFVEMI